MTFAQYWNNLTQKNPSLLESSKITLTVESFKRQLEKAFDAGLDNQYEAAKHDKNWFLDMIDKHRR